MKLKNKIPLSKSVVGLKEKLALGKVIDGSYLGMGSFVQDFERSIKNYLKAPNVICVNSGTAALHLSLMSLGLNPGDEVLVQSLTYVACFQAISASGLTPVACEINPVDCTIDLNDARKRITKKTKVIMPVHYGGRPADLDKIYAFARINSLRVVEDAAHAFGSSYKGKRIGSFGDIACFSFDGIKNITSGEGGAVITQDAEVARFVKDARLLGVHKDTEKRYKGLRSWEFNVFHQGYRYHMSNLFAAIGTIQLERFEKEFKKRRQWLARRYQNELENMPEILLFSDDYDTVVPHIFPIRVLNNKRNDLRQYLSRKNIECGIHYYPNHLLTYFAKKGLVLPITEEVYTQLLSVPLYPGLTDKEQDRVIKAVRDFF